jgi:hypothetical protein
LTDDLAVVDVLFVAVDVLLDARFLESNVLLATQRE